MKINVKFDTALISLIAKNNRETIDKAVAESIEELDGVKTIQESFDNSNLNNRSGILRSSFIQEKTEKTLKVYSNIIYSRIQDQGGWAGRNNTSYIPPTYYFTDGSNRLKEAFIIKLKQKLAK